ncbi:phosphodiesterase YaeI [Luteolibacter pohnpeiensis]|uniref:Phosphodiesterase YaeI n=1 Tax=Luteolibacter pohnpeiensis TaxID=454153 RepID=A0A934S2H8_9BACT|nr:phosphodiesterase YaeI [Luteolibacter pohnpeiensis]MBK1881231.1 phosphodiesterase YaeI [Luteolibacter pohnpeiensis]
MSRRKFFALGGGSLLAAGGGIAEGKREAKLLETTFKKITGLGLKQPIRVLHLSDLHASSVVPWWLISEAVRIGLSHKPDMVFLTGDFVTGGDFQFKDYPKHLAALEGQPNCYACLGNHDLPYWPEHKPMSVARRLELDLKSVGVKLLFNQREDIEVAGQRLRIAGLGDLWCKEVKPEECLDRVDREMTDEIPTLLLAHNPDTKKRVADYRWDVMFSGHTHGGQLVIPVLGWRPILPVEDRSMAEGLHDWRGRKVHVTRGVGNLHGVRLNCPPEVSLLDLS